jgi:predicted amidohydrolase YtcJ
MGVGVNHSVKSVHHLVVSTDIPVTAPKMRKQFSHAVTHTTAKSMKGTTMFKNPSDLQITMQQQFQAWNVNANPLEASLPWSGIGTPARAPLAPRSSGY